MRVLTKVGQTPREALEDAYLQAYKELEVTELDFLFDNPREWHNVKQIVGDIMGCIMFGRTVPKRASRMTPVREGMKFLRDRPIRTYPRKIKNKRQKLNYLKNLFLNGEIDFGVFCDLADMIGNRTKKKIYLMKVL